MKKVSKLVSLALAAASICTILTSCGSKTVTGKFTQTIDSKTYFSAAAVQADLPDEEFRPDGTKANVPLKMLLPMLEDRVADDVAGTSASAGVAEYYTVTLDLADGKYTLTKTINVDPAHVSEAVQAMISADYDPTISVEFSGSYTGEDTTVTLDVPTQVIAKVSPTAGIADAYTRFGGTNMDVTATESSNDSYPGKFFYYFNTPYFCLSDSVSSMTVTVDKNAGTFTIG